MATVGVTRYMYVKSVKFTPLNAPSPSASSAVRLEKLNENN
jgi:hypothetical protein